MAYQNNLQELAGRLSVPLPLRDRNLKLFGVRFSDGHEVFASRKNQGSRLFLEDAAAVYAKSRGVLVEEVQQMSCADLVATAEVFFAEHWDDMQNGGIHPVPRGIYFTDTVTLIWKNVAQNSIEALWEDRERLTPESFRNSPHFSLYYAVMNSLDNGTLRVADKIGDDWITYDWLKKACLLWFRLHDSGSVKNASGLSWDKVPLKGAEWSNAEWKEAEFRLCPGSVVRHGAHIDKKAIIMMLAMVNMGAHIGEGAMVDGGARVGSCAQIGKRVHIGGGSGIGGVFEPLQATPTIIEDDVFIGAMSEISEGIIVESGAVIASGVFITASTPIIDRESGNISYGRIPADAVVVSGTRPDPKGSGVNLYCAVIVKYADVTTRKKVGINNLLRA